MGNPYLVAALDDAPQQHGPSARKHALADFQVDAALAQEVAKLCEKLVSHLSDQDLHLTREDRRFPANHFINVAVFKWRANWELHWLAILL